MRAVYLLIVLGFLRRLMRRVLVPAGRCRVMSLELAGRGYGLVVGGPWEIPEGRMWAVEGNAAVWSEELPEGLRLRLLETDRPVGSVVRFCRDVGVGSPGEVESVCRTVDCCIRDILVARGI